MKKVDYYAMPNQWKMPKWLGVTLGGVFGAIAIGSGVLIYVLVRPAPVPAAAAVAAAPASAPVAAQVAAPSAPVAAPAVAAAEPQAVAPAHHASKRHEKKSGRRVAMASKHPAMSNARASAIIAKHDSGAKHKDKDALDKLLGL